MERNYLREGHIFVKERDLHICGSRRPDYISISPKGIISFIEIKSDQDGVDTFLGRDLVAEGQISDYTKHCHLAELYCGERWWQKNSFKFEALLNDSWNVFIVQKRGSYISKRLVRESTVQNDVSNDIDYERLAVELSKKLYYSNN